VIKNGKMKSLVKKVNDLKAIIECEEYKNFIRYVLFVFRKYLKFISDIVLLSYGYLRSEYLFCVDN